MSVAWLPLFSLLILTSLIFLMKRLLPWFFSDISGNSVIFPATQQDVQAVLDQQILDASLSIRDQLYI